MGKLSMAARSADLFPEGLLARADAAEGATRAGEANRCLDIVISLGLLLATAPLLALVCLLIRLDSRGPILYRQERVGLHGKTFTLLKFRSMVVDAEKTTGPCWAVCDDPRVTRVGRFMRLTRIDEIPQLWNVLRGEMSVVGPRPERPCFSDQLGLAILNYRDRLAVRPGITGWAQIRLPYGASVNDARDKLRHDLYYVRHRSVMFDLRIILGTVPVVLFGRGAR